MPTVPSIDSWISQNATYGGFTRQLNDQGSTNTKTAATANCGSQSGLRFPRPLTLPSSFGAGVTGFIPTSIQSWASASTMTGAFLEVTLGSINLATGTFTGGSAMPSRRIVGTSTSIQLASLFPVMVCTSVVTATNPVITTTYVNQDGTGSRSAAMTIPTSTVAETAFLMYPHLQSGDSGIQSVSNITKSTGTAGIYTVYGLYPLQLFAAQGIVPGLWSQPFPKIVLQPSDVIAFYGWGSSAASGTITAMISGVAES